VIAASGVKALTLVNISVIFGMVVLPFTYYPILRVAEDKKVMGKYVNSKFGTALGGLFLLLITAAAIAAIPLMIVTHSGQP
jgi:Mn2+/Fe2+ NRAMP family transporter